MSTRTWTSGEVATALGIPRQDVTDLLRRGFFALSAEGKHARFGRTDLVAFQVARALLSRGMHLNVATLIARNALFALNARSLPAHSEPLLLAWVQVAKDGEKIVGGDVECHVVRRDEIGNHPAPTTLCAEDAFMVVLPLKPILDHLATVQAFRSA